MDNFDNAPVIWFAIGFVLFILEFLVPGFILFFFALGAWIVAIITLFMELSINSQLGVFIASSLITTLMFRKWLKKLILTRRMSNEIEDEFVGKTAKVVTRISPGNNGKVEFRGTSWDAQSDDTIEKGENVTITGNDSILLIVKSAKT